MSDKTSLSQEHFVATAQALDETTTSVSKDHSISPLRSLHLKSTHLEAHGWLQRFFPQSYLDSVEANWNMGNYVIDRNTGEKHFEEMSFYVRLGMHLLYYGNAQENALHWKKTLEVLQAQSVKMGKEYDSPESKAHILPFVQSFKLEDSLAELAKENIDDYSCFNDFFGRSLKDGVRSIAEPEDRLVTSSPADCRLTAYPTIDLATKYWIKGFGFTLERLLDDKELAGKFDGGSIVIARLAPQDYHRWHSPIDGTVVSVKEIPGAYYTVNPQAIKEPGTLDVFCENKRSVMLLERTETNAPIAVIAVGAMLVGSIKYNQGLNQPGVNVERGQCLGTCALETNFLICLIKHI
jgi:phosphatidylserine decarboxylase